MVDSSDVAVAGAALGGVYLLSARGRGDGDGNQQRPGRIPIPTPGGSGGGISPGLAGLLASDGLGGSGGALGGISGFGEQISGILNSQRRDFAGILQSQQAGVGKLIEQQQKLLDELGNIEIPEPEITVNDGNDGTGSGGSGGSGSSGMSGTQNYRLEAARQGNIPPEARGANVFLEAARGAGDVPGDVADFTADVIGGDDPGAFSTTGGLTGAGYELGQLAGNAVDTVAPKDQNGFGRDPFGVGNKTRNVLEENAPDIGDINPI